MSNQTQTKKSVTAIINPHNQNLESIHKIVGEILGMAGCGHCGRLGILRLDLVGDPSPELGKAGVISLEKQGF